MLKGEFHDAQGIISICSIGICAQARPEPAYLIPKIDAINIAPGRSNDRNTTPEACGVWAKALGVSPQVPCHVLHQSHQNIPTTDQTYIKRYQKYTKKHLKAYRKTLESTSKTLPNPTKTLRKPYQNPTKTLPKPYPKP